MTLATLKMKKKDSLIFNIPVDLKQEIGMFCDLNNIEDINKLILGCLKGGFAIEKFGRVPIKAGKKIIEKEVEKEIIKEIEKIVEVPMETIIEKIIEVPVEKIVEIEKIVTDNTQLEEYSTKVNTLTIENGRLCREKDELVKKCEEYKSQDTQLQNFSVDNDTLQKQIKELQQKIEEYESVLNHFRRFSGTKATHLKSSRLNDELYKD